MKMNGKIRYLGYVVHDFVLEKPTKIPLRADVKIRRRVVGCLEAFYPDDTSIRSYSKKDSLVSCYDYKSGELMVQDVSLKIQPLSRLTILEGSKKSRKRLEDQNITHGYAFEGGKVLCFERDDEISSQMLFNKNFRESYTEALLEFLPLTIAERIAKQDLVRRLLSSTSN